QAPPDRIGAGRRHAVCPSARALRARTRRKGSRAGTTCFARPAVRVRHTLRSKWLSVSAMTPTTDTNRPGCSCTPMDAGSAPCQVMDAAGHPGHALQAGGQGLLLAGPILVMACGRAVCGLQRGVARHAWYFVAWPGRPVARHPVKG